MLERKQLWILTGITAIVLAVSALFYTQGNFLASIIDSGANNASGKQLYISDNYTALSGDVGVISIKSETGLKNISAITFVLKYNPQYIEFTDTINLGPFTNSDGQSFKPEIVMVNPDNTKGEVSIDIASSSSFSLAANQSIIDITGNIKTGLADSTKINLQFGDTQLIDSLYNFQTASTGNGVITIQAVAAEKLKVLNASAVSSTQIEVYFDDFLSSVNTVTAKITSNINSVQTYDDISSEATFSNIAIAPDNGKKIILTTSTALPTGKTFKLVFGTGPKGNIKETLDTSNRTTYFATAASGQGTVELSQVTVKDPSTIELSFSGSPDSVTSQNPLKYRLFNSQGILQVLSQATVSGTITLKTKTALISGEKYYVIAEEIANASNKKIAYFFYNTAKEPTILSLLPESLASNGGSVTVNGMNLSGITKVQIGSSDLVLSNRTEQSITLTIPANLEPKLYDLKFQTASGGLIVKEKMLSITSAQAILKILSDASYASPRRVPNNGKVKTTLWVQVEDPNGVGDVNKVTLDLRPIDGKAITAMVGVDADGQMIIADNKRWFYLDTYIPNTVKTSETPLQLNVTAEDPKGNKAYGTVSLIVTNNTKTSEAPEVLQAYGTPTQIKPGGKAGFFAYVKDFDGIQDIDSVVVDLGPLGLAPQILKPADQIPAAQSTTTGSFSNNTTITGTTNNQTGTVSNTKTTNGTSSTNKAQTLGSNFSAALLEATTTNSTGTTGTTSTTPVTTTSSTIPQQRVMQWYGINDVTIPTTTKAKTYQVTVTATDTSGESGQTIINIDISKGNAPEIDESRTEVSPSAVLPADGKEKFSVKTFVSDEDGIEDITSVNLDLKEIGGTMVEMDLQGTPKKGQKGGYFIAKDLVVAKEATKGVRALKIYASDTGGNEVNRELDVKVTDQNEVGMPPIIDSARSYTTPAAVPADEKTKVTMNVFVEEHNFAITQVIADLSNIAKYTGGQTASSADSANSCLGATERMVCLTPGIQEGTSGRWYTLSNIVILKDTPSSMEPYKIRIAAIDEKGKTGEGYVSFNVGDGTLPSVQTGFPKVQMAISTTPVAVEVLFSNPIDPKKVAVGAFKITDMSNTKNILAITNAVINSNATVVTLTTSEQVPGNSYTLFADAKTLGLKEAQYTDNHADFDGFNKAAIPPQIVKITAQSSTLLEVIFSEGLRPSSVSPNGTDFEIFTNEQTPKRLKVSHVEFEDDNQTLRISTDSQESEKKYILRVQNIYSAAGVKVGGNDRTTTGIKNAYFGIQKNFLGFKYVPQTTQSVIESVDFDKNGKIDFTDFTIFSSVYGQTLQNPTATVSLPEQTTQPSYQTSPLPAVPDATVPATSAVGTTTQQTQTTTTTSDTLRTRPTTTTTSTATTSSKNSTAKSTPSSNTATK